MALTQDNIDQIKTIVHECLDNRLAESNYNYKIKHFEIHNPQNCNFNINSGGFGDTDPDDDDDDNG